MIATTQYPICVFWHSATSQNPDTVFDCLLYVGHWRHERCSLSHLANIKRPLWIILPETDCAFFSVDPVFYGVNADYANKHLPYVIEEDLLTDIEKLEICWAMRGELINAVVLEKSILLTLLSSLKTLAITEFKIISIADIVKNQNYIADNPSSSHGSLTISTGEKIISSRQNIFQLNESLSLENIHSDKVINPLQLVSDNIDIAGDYLDFTPKQLIANQKIRELIPMANWLAWAVALTLLICAMINFVHAHQLKKTNQQLTADIHQLYETKNNGKLLTAELIKTMKPTKNPAVISAKNQDFARVIDIFATATQAVKQENNIAFVVTTVSFDSEKGLSLQIEASDNKFFEALAGKIASNANIDISSISHSEKTITGNVAISEK